MYSLAAKWDLHETPKSRPERSQAPTDITDEEDGQRFPSNNLRFYAMDAYKVNIVKKVTDTNERESTLL
jgi:hypothetical protein